MENLALYKDFETHDRGVDEGKRMASNGVMVMAHHFREIKENKLYVAQGDDGQTSWTAYCASKGMNKNTVEKYIGLYDFYMVEMKKSPEELSDMSIDTLSRYKSALVKSEPAKREDLFQDMKVLSLSDLHKNMVDENLAKPKWLFINKCECCGKYEIHYHLDAVCDCKGVGPAVFVKPRL
jgi:hypothetical protein